MSEKGKLKKAATIKNSALGYDVGFDINYFLPDGTKMHILEPNDQISGKDEVKPAKSSVSERVAQVFDAQNSKVKKLEEHNLFLQAKLNELIDLAKGAPLETGVCVCGDPMETGGMAHGHTPIDVWDHAFERFEQSLVENQPSTHEGNHTLAYTDPESPNPLVDNKLHVVSGIRAGQAYNSLCKMVGGQYPDCRIEEEAPQAHQFFMALFGSK